MESERERARSLLDYVVKQNGINKRSATAILNRINTGRRTTIKKITDGLFDSLLGKKISMRSIVEKHKKLESQLREYDRIVERKKSKKMVSCDYEFWFEVQASKHQKRLERIAAGKRGRIAKTRDIEFKGRVITIQLHYEGIFSYVQDKLKKFDTGKFYYVDMSLTGDDIKRSKGRHLYEMIMESFDHRYNFHGMFLSGLGFVVLRSKTEIGTIKKYDPVNMLLAAEAPKITHKYITYETDDNPKSIKNLFNEPLNSYLEKNYKENSCIYTMLINTYRDKIETLKLEGRYGKDVTLTYEYIWNIIHPNESYDEKKALRESITNMTPFFEKFHIKVTAITKDYRIVYQYIPKSLNKNLFPTSLYLLIHNDHCYRLNSGLKRLEQVVAQEKLNEEVVTDNVSSKYYIANKSDIKMIIDDITKLNTTNIDDEEQHIVAYYLGNMFELLRYLLFEINYIPAVKFIGGSVSSITIKIKNSFISLKNPGQNETNYSIEFENTEYMKKYIELDEELQRSLINKNTLSKYNESLLGTLNNYPRHALMALLKNTHDELFVGCDINKAYTSNLLDLKYFPVFNEFDYFKIYKGEKIEDYNIYIISTNREIKLPEYILLDKKVNAISGMVFKKHMKELDVNICYVAKPSRLVRNTSHGIIKKIYESDLKTEHKKFIVNKTIGLCGKKMNAKQNTVIFSNKDEAYAYKKIHGGQVNIIASRLEKVMLSDETIEKLMVGELPGCEIDEENTYEIQKSGDMVYAVTTTLGTELSEGFLPISFFIYDLMRSKMFELYKSLNKAGAKIYGINTDCLFINNDFKFNTNDINHNTYEAIGLTRFEKDKILPITGCTIVENDLSKVVYIENVKCKDIPIKDEWKVDEFKMVFDHQTGVQVLGDCAGAGKSTCFKKYADAIGREKVLFVCPYNTLCLEYRKQGYETTTLDKLLGLVFGLDNNGVKYDVSKYKVIVFDEIFCHLTNKLAFIKNYMYTNCNIRYFCAGDFNQNKPIEMLNMSDYDAGKYYTQIINELFPKRIRLKINKRLKDENDKKIMEEVRHKILYDDVFDPIDIAKKYFNIIDDVNDAKGTLITYRNETARILNRHFHSKEEIPKKYIEINGLKYYKGLEIKCKKYIKNSSMTCYVNYIYVITDINDKTFTIKEPFEGTTVTLNIKLMEHFTLKYALTCHQVQGVTCSNEVTVFDIGYMFVTRGWLYTALSRVTSLKNIYVYLKEVKQSGDIIKQSLRRKIEGHKIEDKTKGRQFNDDDYVNVNWFKEVFMKQGGLCRHCEASLSVEYHPKDECQYSINRIDNNIAHIKDNCEIVCLRCQHAYK